MSENKKIRDILKKSEKITEDKIESVRTGVIKKSSSGVHIPKKKREETSNVDYITIEREKVEIILDETEEEYSMDLDNQDEFIEEYEEELDDIENAIEKVINHEITEILERKSTQISPITTELHKSFSDMNYQELYDFAKEQRMRGYSSLNKDALIDFIAQNLNGDDTIEKENIVKIKKKEEDNIPYNRIIKHDENILKTHNKGNGFRQLITLKRKIKLCPSMRGVYNHWANKVILHEEANLENI